MECLPLIALVKSIGRRGIDLHEFYADGWMLIGLEGFVHIPIHSAIAAIEHCHGKTEFAIAEAIGALLCLNAELPATEPAGTVAGEIDHIATAFQKEATFRLDLVNVLSR